MKSIRRLACAALCLGVACGSPAPATRDLAGGAADLPGAAGDLGGGSDLGGGGDLPPPDPQLPPQGAAALEAWLQTGAYKGWACESAAMARGGAHGRNRICSNTRLSGSASGDFPAGAAAVKELFDGAGQPRGFAVSLRTKDGAGQSAWYWYERIGASTVADGVGVGLCANCHANAPRDYVYVRVSGG